MKTAQVLVMNLKICQEMIEFLGHQFAVCLRQTYLGICHN
jgi:hypothetical protein